MSIASSIAIWFLFFALSLFVVLPFGVRTAEEAGEERVPGSADSAPVNPMLRRKLLWTALIATILFAVFRANYVHEWLTIGDVPGWAGIIRR